MHSITEKPNKSENKNANNNNEQETQEEDPEFLKVIDSAAMEPYKKFAYPMTE